MRPSFCLVVLFAFLSSSDAVSIGVGCVPCSSDGTVLFALPGTLVLLSGEIAIPNAPVAPPAPGSLVNVYVYRTALDASPQQTLTVNSRSTAKLWVLTGYTSSAITSPPLQGKQDSEEGRIRLESVRPTPINDSAAAPKLQNDVVPGVIVFQPSNSYNFQFIGGNCARDDNNGIVVNNCPLSVPANTPFSLITVESWSAAPLFYYYHAEYSTAPGGTVNLVYDSGPA